MNSSELSKKGVQYGCQKHNYCTKDFCQNGGKCIDIEDRKYCRCQNGYHGDKCEYQNEAHFFNGSLLHFDGTGEINELSMWITSTVDYGLIAYTVCFLRILLHWQNAKQYVHVFIKKKMFEDTTVVIRRRKSKDGQHKRKRTNNYL